MMKNRSEWSGRGLFGNAPWQQSSELANFDLYLQVNEVEKLTVTLDELRAKTLMEKSKFARENEEFLENMQDEVLAQLQETMEGINFEPKYLNMLTDYVAKVRDLMNLIEEIKFTAKVDLKSVDKIQSV